MIDKLLEVDTSFFKEFRYDNSTQQMLAAKENIDKCLEKLFYIDYYVRFEPRRNVVNMYLLCTLLLEHWITYCMNIYIYILYCRTVFIILRDVYDAKANL
jgi:hypothetical protein